MKCIILILTTDSAPFISIEEKGQRPTWIKELSKKNDVKIFFYKYSNSVESAQMKEDYILCPGQELKENIGRKTLEAIKLINTKYNPDYIFRTNISSYIHSSQFLYFIKKIPINKFYSGVIGSHSNKKQNERIKFCSGSGYFISKDLINLCLEKKESWDHSLPDDVAISKIFLQAGISPSPQKRFDFPHLNDIININIPDNIFHFRCKFPPNRHIDIQRMHYLHKHLGYSNEIN